MSRSGPTSISEPVALYGLAERLPKMLLPVAILLLPAASSPFVTGNFIVVTLTLGAILSIVTIAGWTTAVHQHLLFDRPATIAAWALTVFMAVALVARPSETGMILTVAAALGSGIVLATCQWSRAELRRLIAAPLLATATLQSILVIAQTLTDRPVGLSLVETGAELHVIDGLLRAQGTMHHVYEPVALSLLAVGLALTTIPTDRSWRLGWAVAAAIAGSTIGLTHSRAALLGVVLATPFLLRAWRQRRPGVAVVGGAFLIGFVIAAALTSSAWALRGDHSTAAGIDDASLGRVTLAQQAMQMSADYPLLGVGPGRYLDTMRDRYQLDERYPFVVHNVTLAVAAENGIPAAIAATALVAWAIAQAVRSGPLGAVAALLPVGLLLFDVLHYDRPVGLLMGAVWLCAIRLGDDQVTSRLVKSS